MGKGIANRYLKCVFKYEKPSQHYKQHIYIYDYNIIWNGYINISGLVNDKTLEQLQQIKLIKRFDIDKVFMAGFDNRDDIEHCVMSARLKDTNIIGLRVKDSKINNFWNMIECNLESIDQRIFL